jgi:inhibitor of KinA
VSPGGWQIIGRTPVRLFNPQAASPSLLRPGDRVRFRQVSAEEYLEIERAAE